MNISEQIKILCVRTNISAAELARRTGQSPQNFNAKLKRESFTIAELEKMAEAVNSKFERNFILNTGEKIIGEHNE
jgi:transcriptional regulator with XRE-family HTH domain